MAGLTIKHLYKRYDNSGKKKKGAKLNDYAVQDLNLECGQGEFIALLGFRMRQDDYSAHDCGAGDDHKG